MSVAYFTDGVPANLEAAALDALEWLQVLAVWMHAQRSSSECERLDRCIAALAQQLGETYVAHATAADDLSEPAASRRA